MRIVDSGNPGINGALAGSLPMVGASVTGGCPNRAMKYLLDAPMLQETAAPPGNAAR